MKEKIIILLCVIGVSLVSSTISCSLEPSGFQLLAGEYSSPVLLSYVVQSSNKLHMSLSKEVLFTESFLYEQVGEENQTPIAVTVENLPTSDNVNQNQFSYEITFDSETEVGEKYVFSGTVTDNSKNTLSFSLPIIGFNNRFPRMLLSEICSEPGEINKAKKYEFIELYVLEDGNTDGMVIHCGTAGENIVYLLPSAEVKKGEYIVVHMRNPGTEGIVSELGEDLSLSEGSDSVAGARDLWVGGLNSTVSTSDVIVLKDRLNGPVMDCILYKEPTKTSWGKNYCNILAQECFEQGMWPTGYDISNAADCYKMSPTRTFCRQNISEIEEAFLGGEKGPWPGNSEDWFVVATSCYSPGKPNSNKAY